MLPDVMETTSTEEKSASMLRYGVRTLSAWILLALAWHVAAGGASQSGSWDALGTFDAVSGDWEVESGVRVTYAQAPWEVMAKLGAAAGGLKTVSLQGEIDLEEIDLLASIAWDPPAGRVKKLALETEFQAGGGTFDVDLDLYPDHLWTDLRLRGKGAESALDIQVRLGASKAFSFDFYRADVDLSFSACNGPVDVNVRVTAKQGFEWLRVEGALPVPEHLHGVHVEAQARWTVTAAGLVLEPRVEAQAVLREDRSAAIELHCEGIALSELGLDGLRVVGASVDASRGGLWFEGALSLDPGWNKKLTGQKDYAAVAGVGCVASGREEVELSPELWTFSTDPAAPFGADRVDLRLGVRRAGSWQTILAASIAQGSVAEVSLSVGVSW